MKSVLTRLFLMLTAILAMHVDIIRAQSLAELLPQAKQWLRELRHSREMTTVCLPKVTIHFRRIPGSDPGSLHLSSRLTGMVMMNHHARGPQKAV